MAIDPDRHPGGDGLRRCRGGWRFKLRGKQPGSRRHPGRQDGDAHGARITIDADDDVVRGGVKIVQSGATGGNDAGAVERKASGCIVQQCQRGARSGDGGDHRSVPCEARHLGEAGNKKASRTPRQSQSHPQHHGTALTATFAPSGRATSRVAPGKMMSPAEEVLSPVVRSGSGVVPIA